MNVAKAERFQRSGISYFKRQFQPEMGNFLGLHKLKEKLCESCYDDYQTSFCIGSEQLSDVAERGHAHCLRSLIEAGAVA